VVHETSARTRHYGDFHGLNELDETRPLWLVVGNCQAEALRIVLDGVQGRPYLTVRMPAVHELERSDLPALHGLLRRAAVMLSQPAGRGNRP
jgi:hypothetical protein